MAAEFEFDIYVELCRGINATSQINLVHSKISSFYPIYFVWMKVEPSSNPECSWEGYSQSDNCNFLKEAAQAINTRNSPGVFSTARIWKQFFGSSCDTFATDIGALNIWSNYESSAGRVNSPKSFDDYVPFGGWTSPGIKKLVGSVTIPLLCGHKAWHALVE